MQLHEHFSLKEFNTFGIDCSTRWFAGYQSADDVREIVRTEVYKSSPYLLIGQGSNLLFLDDFHGIVLHSAIQMVRVVEHDETTVVIEAGSGMIWDDLVAYAVVNGWWGIENLSLIPGEVGAAAVQNIGAYGTELSDVVESVTVIHLDTGQEIVFPVADCGYGYRTSVFKAGACNQFAILSVRLRLSRVARPVFTYPHLQEEVLRRGEPDISTIRQTIIDIRSAKLPDPRVLGNAGSFFMNPVVSATKAEELRVDYPSMPSYKVDELREKVPAAWLIEQCGWKGIRKGNAGVHANQPLVLVNHGGASGREIADLADEIRCSVADRFGISLVPEVLYVN